MNNLAKVQITTSLILEAIGFPIGTVVKACNGEKAFEGTIEFIVEHHELPEVEDGAAIPLVMPIIRKINEWDWNVPKKEQEARRFPGFRCTNFTCNTRSNVSGPCPECGGNTKYEV